jgi:hypothetical protein
MDAVAALTGGIGWSPWFKRDSSFDRRASSEYFQRTLLEGLVLLESLPTVEPVTPIESSAKSQGEEGGEHMKITISTQTTPAVSTNKTV